MPAPYDNDLRALHAQIAHLHRNWPPLETMINTPLWRGVLVMHWRAHQANLHAQHRWNRQTQAAPGSGFNSKSTLHVPTTKLILDQKSRAAGEREDPED